MRTSISVNIWRMIGLRLLDYVYFILGRIILVILWSYKLKFICVVLPLVQYFNTEDYFLFVRVVLSRVLWIVLGKTNGKVLENTVCVKNVYASSLKQKCWWSLENYWYNKLWEMVVLSDWLFVMSWDCWCGQSWARWLT